MKQSSYKREKVTELKNKALLLYKQGLSTREVSKIVKRSHNWVAMAMRELGANEPVEPFDTSII